MKRFWVLLFAACLFLCGCKAGGVEQGEAELKEWETYVIAIPCNASNAQIEDVERRMNAVLEEELGAHIQIIPFSFINYQQEMQKIFAGSQQIDLMLCVGTYVENWLCGNLLPMERLLDQYGQEIIEAIGEDVIGNCAVNGAVYGIPNIRDYAITTDTYCLNAEILERNGFSIDDISTMEDLEQVFSEIHKKEPDVVILSTNLQSIAANRRYLNPQTPFVSVLDEKQDCYVNYFDTVEYRVLLDQVRDWYQKGYVGFYSEAGEVKAVPGVVLAETRCGKPGAEEEVSLQRGELYQDVCFGKNMISQDVYTAIMYTITKNTISKEMSMSLLAELYQNAELNELLSEILPTWMLPNLFLTEVPEGYPEDLWEQTRRFNQGAERAADVGFVFDPTAVMREYLEVCKVCEQYRPILENGIVDPDIGLARMLEELDAAGIDELLAEQNRQYAAWRDSQQR